MNHVSEQLAAYHHGELIAPDTQRVTEHLAQCETCRAELEAIQQSAALFAQLPLQDAPASLWRAVEQRLPQTKQRWPFTPRLAFAGAAALLMCCVSSVWVYRQITRPSWQVTRLAGTPRVGTQAVNPGERGSKFTPGDWLQTDATSQALVRVGEIGFVKVEPNTEMQLVTAQATEHRLAMKRGKIHAYIYAPPKLFYVNTPSATAVDLGCAYDLEVDDAGQSVLRVTTGWVAFELNGIESFVPAAAMCITRPGFGPGTPYFEFTEEIFKQSLAQFDTSPADSEARAAALTTVLKVAGRKDALTLWHLLTRTQGEDRGRVYDRLTLLVTAPPHVTRAGVLQGDRVMIDALWDLLGLDSASWWRIWKGPVPSATQ
ncbi:MAG: hypothetical protein HOP19_12600 [Acidobacteria bacterium]|nr:hypothetical protein [Acidobacteriota bacterium]